MFGDCIKRHPDVAVAGEVINGKPESLIAMTTLPFGTLAVRNRTTTEGMTDLGRSPMTDQVTFSFGTLAVGDVTSSVFVNIGGATASIALTTTDTNTTAISKIAAAVGNLTGVASTSTTATTVVAVLTDGTSTTTSNVAVSVAGTGATNSSFTLGTPSLPWGIVCQSQVVGVSYPTQFWGETAASATNSFGYQVGQLSAILREGNLWVSPESCSNAITVDQPVYARICTGAQGAILGALRNDSDGGTAIQVTGTYFSSQSFIENYLCSNSLGVTNTIAVTNFGSGLAKVTINRPQ
jgi:hypothetical protein